MIPLEPLLAVAIEDVAGVVVGLIFLVFFVISQLAGATKKGKRPPAEVDIQPPRRDPPRGNQPPPPEKKLADEIDSFLREVQQQPKPVAPPRPTPVAPQPVMASIVEPEPQRLSEGFASLEQRDSIHDVTPSRPEPRRSPSQADQRLEEHVHDVFDHDVGHLGDRYEAAANKPESRGVTDDAATVTAVPSSASEFAEFLRDPTDVRKAIVLSEILNRPSDRW